MVGFEPIYVLLEMMFTSCWIMIDIERIMPVKFCNQIMTLHIFFWESYCNTKCKMFLTARIDRTESKINQLPFFIFWDICKYIRRLEYLLDKSINLLFKDAYKMRFIYIETRRNAYIYIYIYLFIYLFILPIYIYIYM